VIIVLRRRKPDKRINVYLVLIKMGLPRREEWIYRADLHFDLSPEENGLIVDMKQQHQTELQLYELQNMP
jgi:hypothetical protein